MQNWRNESFVDVVNLIFGAWLLAAPWLYGFASGAAGWNAWFIANRRTSTLERPTLQNERAGGHRPSQRVRSPPSLAQSRHLHGAVSRSSIAVSSPLMAKSL